ncbi:hypothetical protein J4429_05000 [Candidatus Pacearchaeota archaeon]|nr:hypothetical protein [Candidatus Pacearchaeota archaeon]
MINDDSCFVDVRKLEIEADIFIERCQNIRSKLLYLSQEEPVTSISLDLDKAKSAVTSVGGFCDCEQEASQWNS